MKPEGDCLRRSEWTVLPVPLSTCHRLEVLHHYARGGSKAGFGYGLFRRGEPLGRYGVAHWVPPTISAARATWPADHHAVLALSRLVVVPGAPTNAASFLIQRSVRLLPARYTCLVSYADEWRGHQGTIYRAAGWEYLGVVDGGMTWLHARTGRMGHARRGQRTLTFAELEAEGFERQGYHRKHKFRLLRGPPRPEKGLFAGRMAVGG